MRRHLRDLAIVTLSLLTWACDSGGGGGRGDAGPSGGGGGGGAAQACEAQISINSGNAGDLVQLQVGDLGDTEFAIVVHAPALSGPTALPGTYTPDDGQITFFAPAMIETMDARTTFAVELHLDGAQPCAVGDLTVAPLPEVGATTMASVTADLEDALAQQMAFLGITEAMLDDTSDPEQAQLLAPLIATRYMLNHPDNPNALTKILDGTARDLSLTPAQRELMDRVLTQVGQDLPPLEQMAGGLRARDLINASIADCGVMPYNIATAEQLECWMGVQETIQAVFGSQLAKYIRATIGVAIGVAGVFTAGVGAAVAGMVNFIANQIVDALENLLPSTLDQITFVATETRLCERERGEIQQVRVRAANNGWTISIFTIVDGVLASVGLGQALKGASAAGGVADALAENARFANLTAQQREAIETGSETLLGIVRDALVNFTGLLAPGTGDLITLGQTHFGPVLLPEAGWYEVISGDSRLEVVVDTYENVGEDTTVAYLTVRTLANRFGADQIEEQLAVNLETVEITVNPINAKSQEQVLLTAEVSCLDDYEILWGTQGTDGGAMIDRERGLYLTPDCPREICNYGGEVIAQLIRPAELDVEGRGDVRIATCCAPDAPTSCTREERCACDDPPPICEAEFYVAPSGECISPGASVDFQVLTDLGGELPEVVWSARALDGGQAGEIDATGQWVAPGDGNRVVIRATDVDDESRWAEASMTVSAQCSAWRISSALSGAYQGYGVRLALPRAVPNDDGELTLIFSLSRSDEPGMLPGGEFALLGHPGFDANCQGPTGTYAAAFAVLGPNQADGLGAERLTAEVTAFGPGGIRVEIAGQGAYLDQGPDGEPRERPTAIQGTISTAEGICTGLEMPDPIGDAVPLGIIRDPEAPSLCLEVFESPDFPEAAWDQVCPELGNQCVDEGRCPEASRVGRCDLRALGTQQGFPQIQHYYPDPDITAAELQQSCELQNGTWYGG